MLCQCNVSCVKYSVNRYICCVTLCLIDNTRKTLFWKRKYQPLLAVLIITQITMFHISYGRCLIASFACRITSFAPSLKISGTQSTNIFVLLSILHIFPHNVSSWFAMACSFKLSLFPSTKKQMMLKQIVAPTKTKNRHA